MIFTVYYLIYILQYAIKNIENIEEYTEILNHEQALLEFLPSEVLVG